MACASDAEGSPDIVSPAASANCCGSLLASVDTVDCIAASGESSVSIVIVSDFDSFDDMSSPVTAVVLIGSMSDLVSGVTVRIL